MGVTNGIGLGYGMPPGAGYGLSADALSKFRQMEAINEKIYIDARKSADLNASQRGRVDSNLQEALADAQAKVNWESTNKKCSNQLQALAYLTRPIAGSKEFIYNSNSVTISDGKKTLIYSKNGLTTVDGQCSQDNKKSIRDGLKIVFESTLPKLAPTAADMKANPGVAKVHKDRMKAHLETLISCESALGTEYVQEMAGKYYMIDSQTSSAKGGAAR